MSAMSMRTRRSVQNKQPTRWQLVLTEWLDNEDGAPPWWKDRVIASNLTLDQAERRVRAMNRRVGTGERFSYSAWRMPYPGKREHTMDVLVA
jgi:hypothetical protein